MTQEENTNKSMQSFNSGDNVNNLLDELPVEQTVLLSKQPKIDMSKVQKDNMLHKSFTSENSKSIQESINSNNYPSKEKVFRSQVLNYNYNNMNNKNDIKKLKYSLTNPLPEMDNDINNNKNKNAISNSLIIDNFSWINSFTNISII